MQTDTSYSSKMLWFFWIAIAALYGARALYSAQTGALLNDTDDAMRLVVVQDLLNGQGFFNHIQYRLNTPFGAEIHWSRLIDYPLAGLLLLLTPIFGDQAGQALGFVWPLLLLLPLLFLTSRIAVDLIGPEGQLPGLVLPIIALPILAEFSPGRIDHHNVQILLGLLLAWASMRAWRTNGWAIIAAGTAATSLAIGLEGLPFVVASIFVFGMMWVVDVNKAVALRQFGLALGGFTILHLLIAQPFSALFLQHCDALSIVHVTASITVAVIFTGLSYLPISDWKWRLVSGAVLGSVGLAGIIMAYPHCLDGPYGTLDPWLISNWIGNIVEAKPIWASFADKPAYTAGLAAPVAMAMAVFATIIWRSNTEKKPEWLIFGAFLLLGTLVMVLQIRGARLAGPFAVPFGAYLIVRVRQAYLAKQNVVHTVGLIASWLGFAGVAVYAAINALIPTPTELVQQSTPETALAGEVSLCTRPDSYLDLAAQPADAIMTPVDLGPFMLAYTPHSVVGAPYHRNGEGVLDTFNFFNKSPEVAQAILSRRGISLVVICPGQPELQGFGDADANSLLNQLQKGVVPDWLYEATPPDAVLRTFAVVAPN